jgi:hypothetical protein
LCVKLAEFLLPGTSRPRHAHSGHTSKLSSPKGKVLERYVGRIPPEAWDRIADLL